MPSYQLIDSGQFRKLEQVGPYRIVRPAASAVWDAGLSPNEWDAPDAEFVRHKDGGGEWRMRNPELKNPFSIEIEGIQFLIKLTSFGHLGIFPEQKANWLRLEELIKSQSRNSTKVLNLFAYTGGTTQFCARAGAEVTHVDASKGTVKWASDNAKASNLSERSIRWIVDDVKEFVGREVRRGNLYHGVVLDPPSYGKGDKKQVWKIEADLMPLLREIKKLLAPEPKAFVCLSAHSEAYTPTSLANQLQRVFGEGQVHSSEMLIMDQQGCPLPSGATALWVR